MEKLVAGFLLILLLFNIAIYPAIGTINVADKADKNKLNFHLPISINGNDEFTKRKGVTGGSGTKEDPYIISNWKIRPIIKTGISISNTDAYFIIENCHVYGSLLSKLIGKSPTGILFSNVENGKILNSGCYDLKGGFGILLMSSSNNIVEGCISRNNVCGLSVNGCPSGNIFNSNNNTIRNCVFSNCEDGIYFCCIPSSYNNIIESCYIKNNGRGICLDHCIHYTTIVGCNISNNKEVGLTIISASSNNHISGNVFWNNGEHAEDNCTNFWDNGPDFGGNYWSEHDSSNPYEIPGVGNNIDDYPLEEEPADNPLVGLFLYSPRVPITGREISFDASLSYDQNDDIASYEWDFDDGANTTGRVVTHTYTNGGKYDVTLKITNATKNDTIVRTIEVFDFVNGEIYVSNGQSIQDAIDTAEPGYNIYVDNGIYYENIVVDKPYLNIIGNDYNNTVIDGKQKEAVIYITASVVNISGFTIKNSSDDKAGIQIGIPDYSLDAIGCRITQNVISENNIAINMSETEQNYIVSNHITNNEIGIYTIRSFHNTFEGNQISLNEKGFWTEYGSNWNDILKNTFTDNSIGIFLSWSHYNVIIQNDIRKNNVGIKLYHAISPKISYNNICGNCEDGIVFTGSLKNAKNNWWGSILGPSFIFSIFGDRVIGVNERGRLKLKSRTTRFTGCRPWRRAPVDIQSPLTFQVTSYHTQNQNYKQYLLELKAQQVPSQNQPFYQESPKPQ